MNRFPSGLSCFLVLTTLFLLPLSIAFAASSDESRSAAEKLMKEGNYQEALDSYKLLFTGGNYNPDHFVDDLPATVFCLVGLSKVSEFDALVEKLLQEYAQNWQVHVAASSVYREIEHFGYMVDGAFVQGRQRGGFYYRQVAEDDRTKSLLHAVIALNLVKSRAQSSEAAFYSSYMAIVDALLYNRFGRGVDGLASLTDLSSTQTPTEADKPLEANASKNNASLNIDEQGRLQYYSLPATFSAAKSDGERLRYAITKASSYPKSNTGRAEWLWANFLWNNFGVQNLDLWQIFEPDDNNDDEHELYGGVARFNDLAKKKLIDETYNLAALTDDQTLVDFNTKLVSVKLPEYLNFIAYFKRIAESGNDYSQQALDILAVIYENRFQLERAADYWERALKKAEKSDDFRAKRLAQINGNWGAFGEASNEDKNLIGFNFRNATEVNFTLYQLQQKEFLKDFLRELKSDPRKSWQYFDVVRNIAQGLLHEGKTRYLGEQIKQWQHSLPPVKKYSSALDYIKLPENLMGAFVLKAEVVGGNTTYLTLWNSPQIIVTEPLADGQFYYVANSVTGQPVPNATVHFLGVDRAYGRQANPAIEKTIHTDDLGQVFLPYLSDEEGYWWLAYTDPSQTALSILGLDGIYKEDEEDLLEQWTRIYAVTSQPAYRPGQTVNFKLWIKNTLPGILQEQRNKQFAGEKVNLTIFDGNYDEVYQEALMVDKYGALEGSFTLATDASLGTYEFEIGDLDSLGSFEVEEYKKTEFEVKVNIAEESVEAEGILKAEVSARYYYGRAVKNAEVSYAVRRYPAGSTWFPEDEWDWLYGAGYWWSSYADSWYPNWEKKSHRPLWMHGNNYYVGQIDGGDVTTNDEGIAEIEINESDFEADGKTDFRYVVEVEVVDSSRRMVKGQGEFMRSSQNFQTFVWLEKAWYQAGKKIVASVAAKDMQGRGIAGTGTLKLFRIQHKDGKFVGEDLLNTWLITTDASGESNKKLKIKDEGQYRLSFSMSPEVQEPNEVRKSDEVREPIESAWIFNVFKKKDSNFSKFQFAELELLAENHNYHEGDEINIRVNSAHSDAHVVLLPRLGANDVRDVSHMDLIGNSGEYTLKVQAGDAPNISVGAYLVKDGEVSYQKIDVAVPPKNKIINIEFNTEKTNYKPGEEVEFKVKLTNAQGKPVTLPVTIAVYDEALRYISGEERSGLLEYFIGVIPESWLNESSSDVSSLVPLSKKGDEVMQGIGVFGGGTNNYPYRRSQGGYAYLSPEGDGVVEEVVVAGIRASMADAYSTRREAYGVVDAISANDIGALPGINLAESLQRISGVQIQNSELEPGRENIEIDIRNKLADSAYWRASLQTNKRGIAKGRFTMPDNLSRWRVELWVAGKNVEVGYLKEYLVTSKDFIVRMQTPRFFVEKDEVVLSANVQNYSNKEVVTTTTLEVDNTKLLVAGSNSQKIKIPAGGEVRVDWWVSVVGEGSTEVRMLAFGNSVSDAIEMTIPAYIHGMLKKESFTGVMKTEQSKSNFSFDIPQARRPEQTRFELNYSPSLAVSLFSALPYLANYPYGCTEQTLNRFLPSVLVQKIMLNSGYDLENISHSQMNVAQPGEKEIENSDLNPIFDSEGLHAMSKSGLARLNEMQLGDGGWGWFSGVGERSSAHTTAYVVKGLLLAKEAGLSTDEDVLARGIHWLQKYEQDELQKLSNFKNKKIPGKPRVDNQDAFVAYVLSLASEGNETMLGKLMHDKNDLSVYGKILLALSLHNSESFDQRDQVIRNINQYLHQDDENQTSWLELANQNYWWNWYGNDIEAHAYYLKLLAITEARGNTAPRIVKYLFNNRKNGAYWNSTRDTALVIESMTEYLLASGENAPDYSLDVLVDGNLQKRVQINKDNILTYDHTLVLQGDELTAGEHQVELVKSGNGPLYYNATLENFSLQDRLTKTGLEIKVQRKLYKVVEHNGGKTTRELIDETSILQSGDIVEIELTLESKNDYEYILLEDMKPAGFEAMKVNSGYDGNALGAYVEYRDNRVAFFISSLMRGRRSISYQMRAEIPGKFSALPARIEAMYSPDLNANSDENTVHIEDVKSVLKEKD